ncbi:HNH endonuclease [Jeotgalibacillus aurantiacus]|uniref:HNH endonuclease n=1 Tax=Jeotgalibacillus aurantiacus TaxID=2763266 RepID=UPI001D0B2BAA|nr:HNH endonuclease [Jeotgalibacillus aurantiacus]
MRKHTAAAKRFYNSRAWRKCRAAYIKSVFGICEKCGKPGYIVDHIIEINIDNINDPDITLNHNNLQYLCLKCHNKKTFKKQYAVEDGYGFDENGDLIRIEGTD